MNDKAGILSSDSHISKDSQARAHALALEQRLRSQNSALVELSKVNVSEDKDPEATLRALVEVAARTLDCDRVGIWRYERTAGQLYQMALFQRSTGEFTSGAVLRRTDYPAYFAAIDEDFTIVAHDAHADPRTAEFSVSYLTPLGISSMLDVPIWDRGEVIGVVCHEHVGAPREWQSDEENFALAIAKFAAIVLDTASRVGAGSVRLRESLQELPDQALDHTLVVDHNHRITYVTPTIQRALGYRTEEMLYKHLDTYVHPDDYATLNSALLPRLESPATSHFLEFRLRHREGTWRHIESVSVNLMGDPDIQGIVLHFRDATERKVWEKAIRESEQRNSAVIENALDAFVSMDESGIVTGWNGQAEVVFGWPRESAIGKDLSSLIVPERLRQAHVDGFKRFLQTGNTERMRRRVELTGLHRDGHEFPVELSVTHSLVGGSHTFSAFLRDISERKATEKALHESEERFRTLVEHAPEAIVVIDVETLKFVDANHNAERLFGLSREQLMTVGPLEVSATEQSVGTYNSELVHDRIRQALSGESPKFEWNCRNASGRGIPCEVRLVRLPATGRQLIRGSVTDIRERKWAQELHKNYSLTLEEQVAARTQEIEAKNLELEATLEKLRQTQSRMIIQEKMASLGVLTAGIAHEIKNPLNFVNNFAELTVELVDEARVLLEKHGEKIAGTDGEALFELFNDISQNAARIREHGRRADGIVQSMLLHSRGKTDQRRPADLNAIVTEFVKLAYHGMRARDASFRVKIDMRLDDTIPPIPVVSQDISRVVLNLVNNACYAAYERKRATGGEFAPEVIVQTTNKADSVEFRVRDNGVGIPEDIRESVFTPFFTTKPAGEGTGLGLSICYDIVVSEHGGQIAIDSEKGSFTEVRITLPKELPDVGGGI
ncbi:MAG: PAS domain S-box protein [Candidatus Hydrogenedentes bacterium]|nr:PAS domain S-box protein [Candidatus Hydrogenedentota bacterium]